MWTPREWHPLPLSAPEFQQLEQFGHSGDLDALRIEGHLSQADPHVTGECGDPGRAALACRLIERSAQCLPIDGGSSTSTQERMAASNSTPRSGESDDVRLPACQSLWSGLQ